MEKVTESKSGRLLYGFFFIVVLPLLLAAWGTAMESVIALPAIYLPISGLVLMLIGALIVFTGIHALNIYGMGLPMNAYPPPRFVNRGIYALIPHPIYTGAALGIGGMALYLGSSAALWFILPLFVLGCFALVWGYERIDLEERFPNTDYKPLASLPEASEQRPTLFHKFSYYPLVLLPWALAFGSIQLISFNEPYLISFLPFEISLPVIKWTAVIYLLIYPLGLIAPFFARTRSILRDFLTAGLAAAALGVFISLIAPLATPPKFAGDPDTWSQILSYISIDPYGLAAFPSFYVIWTWLSVTLYARSYPAARWFWYLVGTIITASLYTSGINSLVDIAGGFMVFVLAAYNETIWQSVLQTAEHVANSWKEWHLGPVRVLNHGFYGAGSVAVGILLIGVLIGPETLPAVLLVTVVIMLTAALWAQLLEGSGNLLRPLGFYGGVLGTILGSALAAWLFQVDFFLLWAAFSMAAPWVQAIGRIRCLIQGCCHGAPSGPQNGIRYYRDKSRVVRLADLKGEFLHPTPLYSMVSNVVIGILLLKLWFTGSPLTLIIGLTLILNSLSRFVEEAYRGEPQTPVVAGLRIYQWLAIGTTILGAVVTVIPSATAQPALLFSTDIVIYALIGGLLGLLLTGVDFPRSDKRFSRLV